MRSGKINIGQEKVRGGKTSIWQLKVKVGEGQTYLIYALYAHLSMKRRKK